jgi:hypothetical protein
MSKHQYLRDQNMSWHPHLMFFIPGNAAESWGANLPGSPVLATDDPEERVTILNGPGWKMVRWDADFADGALTLKPIIEEAA